MPNIAYKINEYFENIWNSNVSIANQDLANIPQELIQVSMLMKIGFRIPMRNMQYLPAKSQLILYFFKVCQRDVINLKELNQVNRFVTNWIRQELQTERFQKSFSDLRENFTSFSLVLLEFKSVGFFVISVFRTEIWLCTLIRFKKNIFANSLQVLS